MTQIDHATLRDRMPDVATAQAAWSALEQAHLDGCDACRDEWTLVYAAARLGARVEREFDAPRAAAGVVARWRKEPAPARRPLRWAALGGLAAAAAVALVVLLPRASAPTPVASPLILTELDSLTTDELVLVADGLDLPLTELKLPDEAPLSDLDTIQLARILRSLEG